MRKLIGAPALASALVILLASSFLLASCRSESEAAPPSVAPIEDASDDDAAADAADRIKGCPGEAPTEYPWQAPLPAVADACTEADLSRLEAAIAGKTLTSVGDIADNLGEACAACAVGRTSDERWRAVLEGHQGYLGNVGGCVVHLGGSEACGRGVDRLSTCLIVGCDGCEDRAAQDVCADKLTGVDGACAGFLRDVRKECKAPSIKSAFDANGICQSFVETIRLFCGPPARDGG